MALVFVGRLLPDYGELYTWRQITRHSLELFESNVSMSVIIIMSFMLRDRDEFESDL